MNPSVPADHPVSRHALFTLAYGRWPGWVWLWIAILAMAAPAQAQEPKIKVLIVEGLSNHDWRHRVDIVRAILARDGSFEVDVTVAGDPGWREFRSLRCRHLRLQRSQRERRTLKFIATPAVLRKI